MTTGRARAEDGFSLAEVLVAVSLLGLVLAAIVGAMTASVVGSDVQRKQATADTVLRSYAEVVKEAAYQTCATPASYAPAAVGFPVPSGFTASVSDVDFWDPDDVDPNTGSFIESCGTDEGLQLLTLQVSSTDGRVTDTRDSFKRRP